MNHDDVRSGSYLRGGVGALALAYLSLIAAPAHALEPQSGYTPQITVNQGSASAVLAPTYRVPSSPPTAAFSNVAQGVRVSAPASLQLSNKVAVALSLAATVPAVAMASPWLAAVSAVGVVAMLAVPAFQDAYARAKLRVSSTGALEVGSAGGVAQSSACATADYGAPSSDPDRTPIKVCVRISPGSTTWIVGWTYTAAAYGWPGATFPCGDRSCQVGYPFDGVRYIYGAPEPGADYTPISSDAAAAKLWENVPPVAAEVQALADLGHAPEVPKPTITGPAEVPLFNTVEILSPGEKKMVAELMKLDYTEPGTVKLTKQTTTTVAKDATTATVTTAKADGTTETGTILIPAKTTTTVTTDAAGATQEKSECTQYPNRVGCAELGSAAETPLPAQSRDVTFAPVAFASNASCPPPLVWSGSVIAGSIQTFTVPYTPLCAGAAIVRTWILLAAAVAAAMIFAEGLKA